MGADTLEAADAAPPALGSIAAEQLVPDMLLPIAAMTVKDAYDDAGEQTAAPTSDASSGRPGTLEAEE